MIGQIEVDANQTHSAHRVGYTTGRTGTMIDGVGDGHAGILRTDWHHPYEGRHAGDRIHPNILLHSLSPIQVIHTERHPLSIRYNVNIAVQMSSEKVQWMSTNAQCHREGWRHRDVHPMPGSDRVHVLALSATEFVSPSGNVGATMFIMSIKHGLGTARECNTVVVLRVVDRP